jgi:hypothetical protein
MHIDYIWGTRQTEQDQIITRTSQYWGSGKESDKNNHYNYRELTTRHLAIASAPEVLWLLRAELFRMNIKQFCRPRSYRRHFSSKWGSTSPSQTCHPIQTYHHGSTSLAASASSTPSVGGPALMSAPPHPIKKAKCSSFKSRLLFTFVTPEYSGLRLYFVTTNILGYLVTFFSPALDISSPA